MIDVRESSKNVSDSIYSNFEHTIHTIWGKKLLDEFGKQKRMYIDKHFPYNTMSTPSFSIDNVSSRWGQWDSQKQTISIFLRLLRDYPWDSVIETLKHEMAHMIVSEIFEKTQNLSDQGHHHGELFKKACVIMNLEIKDKTSDKEKLNYIAPNTEKIVSKIKKLMALGESNHKKEAELAITKAHELMVKYNISFKEIPKEDRIFLGRPVGDIMKKVPSYLTILTNLISEYYFVNAIFMLNRRGRYVELFGEPHNLDVAEYVYHFLPPLARRVPPNSFVGVNPSYLTLLYIEIKIIQVF